MLRDQPDRTTRLLVRDRYEYSRTWMRLFVEPAQAISFLTAQKMLRGVKDRAERSAGSESGRHHVHLRSPVGAYDGAVGR